MRESILTHPTMPHRFLITGATGFVGSHIAEACVARGHLVSAIARSSSDVSFLQSHSIAIHTGDCTDALFVNQALADVDVVVHCAAKVGDQGLVEDYRAVNVQGLRTLLEAGKNRSWHRFVQMSSLGVYEARHHYGTDESVPASLTHFDGYSQSKAEAEQVAVLYHKNHGIPVVVLRPGFVYGPRDRNVLPKLIDRLHVGKVHYLGGGRMALNATYIGNLVDAVFLAIDDPQAIGQIYNLTDGESVTKQRFIEAIAEGMGYKKPRQVLPRWLAAILVKLLERQIRRAGPNENTRLTPAQFKFLLLNLDFSIEKAKRELSYQPRVGFDQAMRETMAWYRENT